MTGRCRKIVTAMRPRRKRRGRFAELPRWRNASGIRQRQRKTPQKDTTRVTDILPPKVSKAKLEAHGTASVKRRDPPARSQPAIVKRIPPQCHRFLPASSASAELQMIEQLRLRLVRVAPGASPGFFAHPEKDACTPLYVF